MTEQEKAKRTFTEEVEVTGNQVIGKIQEVIKKGNVRRVIVRTQDGRVLLDTTLTMSVGVGGVLTFFGGMPLILLAGAVALLSKVKLEIVREIGEGDILESKQKVEIKLEDEA